ncbi:MAG: CHRD domain-containing protein [Gemmatimonadetes bacterium]|nr:CHRD domain-containing protein [Gemmatimonadota bacterium]
MRKIATLFFSGLAFLGVAAIGCNGYDQETFTATLNGANEVPATAVTATATFSVVFDGPAAKYTLNIGGSGLTEITASHIHTGAAGTSGGVWVYLFDGPTTPATTPFRGNLGVGSFTQDMVAACTPGCAAGGSYDGIRAAAALSTVYVNVHTVANAGGAVRGQIHP